MKVKKRSMFLVVTILVVFYIYFRINLMSFSNYMNPPWNPVHNCVRSKQELQELIDLTYEVHHVLNSLNIQHWIMYGTIFGAMRMEGPLPWDNDVDIGLCGDCNEFASFKTIQDFTRHFKEVGLMVKDKWLQSGTLVISKPNQTLTVDIFAFYEHNGWKKRTGLESWLFFINYNYHHTFPSWTVQAPLPKVKFGHFKIPKPKGEFEILKYLYRDNWWQEAKPKGCKHSSLQ